MPLKPCVVFDIDETLVITPPTSRSHDVMAAKPISPMVFLYQAIDFMINDPPQWLSEERQRKHKDWPQDIFFITSRSEELREDTIHSLCNLTYDTYSSINKRLLMRPEYMNCAKKDGPFEVKSFLCKKLKERGYEPTLIFDDSLQALKAFKKNFPNAFLLRSDPLEEQTQIPLSEWIASRG